MLVSRVSPVGGQDTEPKIGPEGQLAPCMTILSVYKCVYEVKSLYHLPFTTQIIL